MSPSVGFYSYLRIRRLLCKYYTPAQLDLQQKHATPFVDYFRNPTGESGEVIYINRFKGRLSVRMTK